MNDNAPNLAKRIFALVVALWALLISVMQVRAHVHDAAPPRMGAELPKFQPYTFSAPLNITGNAVSIPSASISQNGYIASSDFTRFNNIVGLPTSFDWPGTYDALSIGSMESTSGNFSTGHSFMPLVNGTYTTLTFYTSGSGKSWVETVTDPTGPTTLATNTFVSTGHKQTATVASFSFVAYHTYVIWVHCTDNVTYMSPGHMPSPAPWPPFVNGTTAGSPVWTYGSLVYLWTAYATGNAVPTTSNFEAGHWNHGFAP